MESIVKNNGNYNYNAMRRYVYHGLKITGVYFLIVFICFCLCYACEVYYHTVCCPIHLGIYHGISSCIVKSTSVTCYVSRSSSDYLYGIITRLYFETFQKFF